MGTDTELDAGAAESAGHELRFPSREVACDGHEFNVRGLFLNRCLTVARGGVGVLILQLAGAVATANDVGLELRVAAPTVANHHARILPGALRAGSA
jgi:hypothetical protein